MAFLNALSAHRLALESAIPLALPGSPSAYGVTQPAVMARVDPQDLFKYLYRAASVLVSVNASYQQESGTYSVNASFVANRYGGEPGGNFDFYREKPSPEAVPPTRRKIMVIREGFSRAVGNATGLFQSINDPPSAITVSINVTTLAFTPLAVSFFADSSRRYAMPGLLVTLDGLDVNYVSGSFLGSSYAINSAVSAGAPRRSATVNISIAGQDLAL